MPRPRHIRGILPLIKPRSSYSRVLQIEYQLLLLMRCSRIDFWIVHEKAIWYRERREIESSSQVTGHRTTSALSLTLAPFEW